MSFIEEDCSFSKSSSVTWASLITKQQMRGLVFEAQTSLGLSDLKLEELQLQIYL